MILTVFGMDTDTAAIVLPIATSLLIFMGGGLAKVLSDNVKKHKDIKSSRNVVFHWSCMTINATKKQISALETLSKSISETVDLLPISLQISKNMADKLQDVSADRMTLLFVTNSKPKRGKKDEREKYAFNIVSQYDYLTSNQVEIRNKYEIYNHACHDIINRWNTVMKKLQRDRDNLNPTMTDGSVLAENKEVSNVLNTVFDSYLSGQDMAHKSFIDLYEGIVKPLNYAADKCKTNFPDSNCGKAIYEDAREMLLIHRQWVENKRGYSTMFRNIAETLRQSTDSLSDAVHYFESSTS